MIIFARFPLGMNTTCSIFQWKKHQCWLLTVRILQTLFCSAHWLYIESNGFILLQYHINSTKIVKHKAVFRLVLYDMLETFKICSSNSSTYQGCSPSSWDQNSWVLPSEFTSLERAFCNQAVYHSFIALVKRWLLFRDRVTESHQATETHKSGINSLLQSGSYSRSTAILGHAYFIWATIDQWKHLM